MGTIDKKSGAFSPDQELQVSAYDELLRNGTAEGLSFDEETHTFTVDGKAIPSVTTILKQAGLTPDYSMLDPFYAQRGTAIHKATELWENRTLDEDSVDPRIVGYVDAYKAFRGDWGGVVKGQEVMLWHPRYHFAGIIDMVTNETNNYLLFLKKTGKYKLVEVKNLKSHLTFFLSALIVTTGHVGAGLDIAESNLNLWKRKFKKEAANG